METTDDSNSITDDKIDVKILAALLASNLLRRCNINSNRLSQFNVQFLKDTKLNTSVDASRVFHACNEVKKCEEISPDHFLKEGFTNMVTQVVTQLYSR